MFKLFIASILFFGTISTSFAICGPPDKIDAFILEQHEEEKTWIGISELSNKGQQLTFLYENPKTGSWTIAFFTLETNQTCIVAGGESSTHANTKSKGSKL
jgi:hypothetical protein|tara:strand:- start:6 stop:308 length:303 start_codon:yes stop_codon:yes gene_type:complete